MSIIMCYVNISSDVQNIRYDGVNVNISMCYVNISSDIQNARYDGVNV